MDGIAGMKIIELYEVYHAWAIIDVIAAIICIVLSVVALGLAFENDGSAYITTCILFFILSVSLFVIGIPNVHEKGFRAKVDNVLSWSEISVNYSMIDLDEDGVFTFRER